MEFKTYIVTVKKASPMPHNPADKQVGECTASEVCTDVTGAHHSFLVGAYSATQAHRIAAQHYSHITRVELASRLKGTQEHWAGGPKHPQTYLDLGMESEEL